jgi:hypothetical protein
MNNVINCDDSEKIVLAEKSFILILILEISPDSYFLFVLKWKVILAHTYYKQT